METESTVVAGYYWFGLDRVEKYWLKHVRLSYFYDNVLPFLTINLLYAGVGGRAAILGHGSHHHQPQQAGRRHPRHGQSLAGFSRQAFWLVDFLIDAGIPDTVSHWLCFPARLSDWLIFLLTPASQTRSVIGWFSRQAFWLLDFRFDVWWTRAFRTQSVIGWFFPPSLLIGWFSVPRSVIGWFFPPSFLIGWFSLRSGLVFDWRQHSGHGQSLAGFSRQAFELLDFRFDHGWWISN